jgi:hypothetical protein
MGSISLKCRTELLNGGVHKSIGISELKNNIRKHGVKHVISYYASKFALRNIADPAEQLRIGLARRFCQSLIQVSDQIVCVFCSNRNTHNFWCRTGRALLLFSQLTVCR